MITVPAGCRQIMSCMLALTLFHGAAAHAQNYPSRSVRLVVPYGIGGNADLLSRIFADKLAESLGQPFLVDNRPGANGVIGADIGAKAPPDGYTLLFIASGHAINPALYDKMPFDAANDFSAISQVGTTPLIITVNASLPADNLKELIALARSKSGQLNFASAGNGSPGHLAGALFNSLTGVQTTHVPYKATAQAMTDVMSGRVQLMYPTATAALPFLKTGKLRGLAITGNQRSALAPDILTFQEAGLPGYDSGTWTGFVAPAHTPQPIIERVNRAIVAIIKTSSARERIIGLGADPLSSTPAEFATLIASEIQKWGKVVKEAGVRMD